MQTLIELYDERATENVIGPETFRPEHIIYLCPPEVAENRQRHLKMKEYFSHRGLDTRLEFVAASMYKADKIIRLLHHIAEKYPDCVLDVTGGTEAALFAAGMFCSETGIPTFTYSRKKNRFFDICNAPYADELPCTLKYRVEDFFLMAGGTMRKGRVDNHILADYEDTFDPFFRIFLKYRKRWVEDITFLQRISKSEKGISAPLYVKGSYIQKGERGSRINANPALLKDLEKLGFIKQLCIHPTESVAFSFADDTIRNWLRDVGSVLELYMYKACRDAGIFDDVISSAIVDWDGTVGHDSVSNEIDVVASRGCVPIFISCKTCEIKTEAINELAILRDRFGGKGAKAVLTTTEHCNAAARHRAAQLGIAVIDLEELESGQAAKRLRVIMKAEKEIAR